MAEGGKIGDVVTTSWKHEENIDVVQKIASCAGEPERWNKMKNRESK